MGSLVMIFFFLFLDFASSCTRTHTHTHHVRHGWSQRAFVNLGRHHNSRQGYSWAQMLRPFPLSSVWHIQSRAIWGFGVFDYFNNWDWQGHLGNTNRNDQFHAMWFFSSSSNLKPEQNFKERQQMKSERSYLEFSARLPHTLLFALQSNPPATDPVTEEREAVSSLGGS